MCTPFIVAHYHPCLIQCRVTNPNGLNTGCSLGSQLKRQKLTLCFSISISHEAQREFGLDVSRLHQFNQRRLVDNCGQHGKDFFLESGAEGEGGEATLWDQTSISSGVSPETPQQVVPPHSSSRRRKGVGRVWRTA